MSSQHGNRTLRERAAEVVPVERNLRRSDRNDEKSQDGAQMEGSNDLGSRKPKKVDGRGTKYDSEGIHKESGKDLCDCLDEDCEGCWMPCKKCRSEKCGHECRRNRKWCYDKFDIEGTRITVKNKYK